MRSKSLPVALLSVLLLPSCMTTNMLAWADTRLESPSAEHMRQGVATLTLIPLVVADVVLLPFQLLGGFYPYGDGLTPDPPEVRHGT